MSTFGTVQQRIQTITRNQFPLRLTNQLVNRVHQEELEGYSWVRRRTNTVVSSVAPKTGGTVALTQGSLAVVGTGTAFAASDVGRQAKFSTDVPLFTIGTFTDATHITLTAPWPGLSTAGAPYTIYTQFYSISGADQIINITQRDYLEHVTREDLNYRDPQRNVTSNPSIAWAPTGRTASDDAQFELWGLPSAAAGYAVEYLIKHTDFTVTSDRLLVPGSIVEYKALWDVCVSVYADNGDPRWIQMAQSWQAAYEEEKLNMIGVDKQQQSQIRQVRDTVGYQPGMDVLYNRDL